MASRDCHIICFFIMDMVGVLDLATSDQRANHETFHNRHLYVTNHCL